MMRGRFHKMHGLGNDFVVIDARIEAIAMSSARAAAIADRRTGIGCDQLILLERSDSADARMRTWNPDGSEVEICGNAARAVALLIGDSIVETKGGPVSLSRTRSGAMIDMGSPRFEWEAIPLAYSMDTRTMPVAWDALSAPAAVNVGNPHIVFFVDDAAAVDLDGLAPRIENDAIFPERVNVGVAQVTGPSSLDLRVWERGTGITRACGTGACAAAVLGILARRVSGPVTVTLPGGDLVIEWSPGETIRMTGPATHVYDGEIDWDQFPA